MQSKLVSTLYWGLKKKTIPKNLNPTQSKIRTREKKIES